MRRQAHLVALWLLLIAATRAIGQESPKFPGAASEATRPPLDVTTNAIPGFGTYTYDGSGNIKSIGDTVSSDSFVYDRLGRLESATLRGEPCAVITAGEPCRTQKFTYDRYGNIVTVVSATAANNALQTQTMAVDESTNQIDKAGSAAAIKGTYDARGNLKTYNFGTFEYDGLDMVTEATVDGVRRFHVYSASDERVVTIGRASGIATGADWTIRDPGGRVLRRFTESPSGTFTWAEDYVYRNGQLLAAAVPGPEKIRHFHLDHLGTPRLVTGNGGVQLAEHHYQPFGSELSSSTIDGEKAKFTGHERDTSTLDYMHARYYSPAMGRFLSVDPTWESADLAKPQTWNRYSYVMNNPANMVDPDGKAATLVTAGIGALTGAGVQIATNLISGDDWDKHVVKEMTLGAGLGLTGIGIAKVFDKGLDAYRTAKITAAARNADRAVDGTRAGRIVLGHYPEYVKLADTLNARRFNIPMKVWEKMSDAQRWTANKKFLDRAIARGDDIILATPISKVKAGRYYEKELKYLMEKGYTLSDDGTRLVR